MEEKWSDFFGISRALPRIHLGLESINLLSPACLIVLVSQFVTEVGEVVSSKGGVGGTSWKLW